MQTLRMSSLILAGALAASPSLADEVRVIGTGAVQHSINAVAKAFESETGDKITARFGTAGAVSKMFEAGEDADVLVSSAGGVKDIAGKGKLAAGEPTPVGKVRIGIGVCNGAKFDTATPEALKAALLSVPAFAYGDPASGATTGVHFAKLIDQLGVADAVKGKAMLRNGGLEVMKEVAAGKAAFGVTQTSEIITQPGCTVAGFLPDSMQLVTTYSAQLTKTAKTPSAQKFLTFLTSAKGAEIFRKEGFEPAR